MAVAAFAAAAVAHRRGGVARANAMLSKGIERFWTAMILTILAHLFMLGFHAAMLLALNIEALTLEIASALVIVMFVSSLPISLGGWGVRELSAVAALGAVGIEPSAALAAALLVGIFSLGANLAIAFPGVFLVLNSRLAREPGTQHANGTLNWNSRLVTGCAVLMAVAIFFQVRLETGSGQLTANAADLLALMGLASPVSCRKSSLESPFSPTYMRFPGPCGM